MTINKDTEAKILRYHFVEKWRTGTIATQLGIHHGVVDRVLSQAGLPKIERTQRTSMLTPYLPFIIKTLDTYPTLTAVRLYEMAKQRGYSDGSSQFRHRISELRPCKQPEAYLRLKSCLGSKPKSIGTLRTHSNRASKARINGVCDGAKLDTTDIFTVLRQSENG
ncbi:MAG: transposase [Oleiphilaceae bacterium]|jgi:transposase